MDQHTRGRLFAYKQIVLILQEEEWTVGELIEALQEAIDELEFEEYIR